MGTLRYFLGYGALLLMLTLEQLGPVNSVQAKPVEGKQGMVVAVSAEGADVGVEILRQGGNAVDAAVATALAMAVTYPQAGNIGGGGFMLIHPGKGQKPVVIEYRETAPAKATADMFAKGHSLFGHKVVGVPGTVRGLELAHKQFGKLPWKTLVFPAVKLAEEGFTLNEHMAWSLNNIVNLGEKDFPELARVFGKAGGKSSWEPGDRLKQPELARTLRRIAEEGPDAFYQGVIADQLAAEMKAGGGLITKKDLASYRAMLREPIHGTYRGHDIYGPPPPSSGGICLVQMLNVLENFDLKKEKRWSAPTLHLLTETMKRAFCDRARHLGDPAFTKVPDHLTSKEYAKKLAQSIRLERATPSKELAPDIQITPAEGDSTTHFSVLDKDGMAVSNTYTLEQSYGSRVVVKGAGFLLNNEMMDFNWRPGFTDTQGKIGTPPNVIAPGKRMLSSQTPTIVAKGGRVLLVTGSPGSRTIINTVLCVVVNVLDFGMPIDEAVNAPRQHHQWLPDVLRFEGMDRYPATVKQLRKLGHTVHGTRQGDAHSIFVDPRTGLYLGAADPRISGKAAGY